MILEGVMTTVNPDGTVNVSPMGPIVDAQMQTLILRPYQTSTTYKNLKRTRQAVFHVTDDVEMIAHAAVGPLSPRPAMRPAACVDGYILNGACRWYALQVDSLDDSHERTEIMVSVVGSGRQRDFLGFNRAKHAVVEAAILATRVALLPAESILEDFERLRVPVEKTGGPQETAAFAFLNEYVQQRCRQGALPSKS